MNDRTRILYLTCLVENLQRKLDSAQAELTMLRNALIVTPADDGDRPTHPDHNSHEVPQ
jgi:hypothetical protein